MRLDHLTTAPFIYKCSAVISMYISLQRFAARPLHNVFHYLGTACSAHQMLPLVFKDDGWLPVYFLSYGKELTSSNPAGPLVPLHCVRCFSWLE